MYLIPLFSAPWVSQMSKKTGHKYYYCIENKKPRSEYTFPKDAAVDTVSAFTGRVMWPWEPNATDIFEGRFPNGISRADMEDFIKHNVKR